MQITPCDKCVTEYFFFAWVSHRLKSISNNKFKYLSLAKRLIKYVCAVQKGRENYCARELLMCMQISCQKREKNCLEFELQHFVMIKLQPELF